MEIKDTEVSRRQAIGGWLVTYDITDRVRSLRSELPHGRLYYSEVFVSDKTNIHPEPILIKANNSDWMDL